MSEIRSICVFCGSRVGDQPEFTNLAIKLGKMMAEREITLVYGAGSIGLMGIVARQVIAGGGKAIGVIPGHLDDIEITQPGLTECIVTDTMHERKMLMFERSDAVIVLPGGLGTVDEMAEVITWAQLRLHDRPIHVVNMNGFWDPFIELVDHIIERNFAGPTARALFSVVETLEDIPYLASEEI